MIRQRRAVLAAASLVMTLTSFAGAAVTTSVLYRPIQPPCGDYIDDCPKPRPHPFPDCRYRPCRPDFDRGIVQIQAQAADITGAISDGKMDQASEGLNSFFTGSGAKGDSSQGVVVAAGEWSASPSVAVELTQFKSSSHREVVIPLIERDGDARFGGARVVPVGFGREVGVGVGIEIIKEGVKQANEAAERYVNRDQTNESKEKYGGCRMKGTCSK